MPPLPPGPSCGQFLFLISAEESSDENPLTVIEVGSNDQQVFYSFIRESDGHAEGEFFLICPKIWDQKTVSQFLIDRVKEDPNNKGKIVILVRTLKMMVRSNLLFTLSTVSVQNPNLSG